MICHLVFFSSFFPCLVSSFSPSGLWGDFIPLISHQFFSLLFCGLHLFFFPFFFGLGGDICHTVRLVG